MKRPKSSNTDPALTRGRVREVTAEDTLRVRSLALKWGLAPARCLLPDDHAPGVFHLGVELDGQVVAVATFLPENLPDLSGKGFRLRQMGVLPSLRRLHLGERLVAAGVERLRQQGVEYLWCNARRIAYEFYEAQGMAFRSGEFEVPGVGPHRQMIRQIGPPKTM